MVLVINLDEESAESDPPARLLTLTLRGPTNTWPQLKPPITAAETHRDIDEREIRNIGSFSAGLACYPVIAQITRDLDLNSLDNISRTCRLFRALLHAHRKSLIAIALRCSSETHQEEKTKEQKENAATEATPSTPYKRSPCAIDLVGECRRCGVLVCRNCTAKALSPARLAKRHRRLCKTCLRAPLSMLTAPHLDSQAFTYPAFARGACECAMFFWLCQPCGKYFPAHDTSYFRIWMWRISYSTHLGGLGTGIGEGYEGVKCGRGTACLAARRIEVEEDCGSESIAPGTRDGDCAETTLTPMYTGADDHDPEKAGYFRQEVEGLGGHLRGKIKKMVVVGQTVEEHEDERENGGYLNREAKGLCRSWCSWCERVIPSIKEMEQGSLVLRGAI